MEKYEVTKSGLIRNTSNGVIRSHQYFLEREEQGNELPVRLHQFLAAHGQELQWFESEEDEQYAIGNERYEYQR